MTLAPNSARIAAALSVARAKNKKWDPSSNKAALAAEVLALRAALRFLNPALSDYVGTEHMVVIERALMPDPL